MRALDSLVGQVHADGARPQYLNDEVELRVGDVRDANAVRAALDDVDSVVHLAARVGVGQSMYELTEYTSANSLGTAVLLQAVAERPVRKLVVASSMSVYGEGLYVDSDGHMVEPPERTREQLAAHQWDYAGLTPVATPERKRPGLSSIYALNKYEQERACLIAGPAYGVPTVALRLFNTYGPRQALSNPYTGVCAIFSARLLNKNRPLVFEDGEQSRDFVHVSDIVRANLLVLETDRANYEAINIGTGRATSIRDVSRLLADGLGVDLEPEIVGKYREGDIRHCVADISKAKSLLGYEPQVSLENGIPELLKWVKEQAARDKVESATAELESRQLVR